MYGYGFLSGGKRPRCETLHASSTTVRDELLPFWWTLAGGESRRRYYFRDKLIEIAGGQSELDAVARWQLELGAAPSSKAVWWDFRLASLLTHLLTPLQLKQQTC